MTAKRTDIRIYRAWKLKLVFWLVLIVAIVGGWELYRFGRSQAGGNLDSLYAERDRLQLQLAELDARNTELERQIAVLERSRQIDQQAYAVFKQERSGLQNELRGLREELAFYRGILEPDQDKVGLQAQDFSVESALAAGRYRYRFVLTQAGAQEQVARGVVHLSLEGLQDATAKRLTFKEISESGATEIGYRFRYFQTFEGELQLPENFVPERVILQAVPNSAPRLPLEWIFDWPLEAGGLAEEN